jgi:four helix bundle protein
LNFLNIATGSAAEVEYLIPLAVRLNLAQPRDAELIARGYSELSSALRAMIRALEPRLSSPEA